MVDVLVCAGTRPELIRMAPTIHKLKKYFNTKFAWLNQNYSPELSETFLKEFGLEPDVAPLKGVEAHGIKYVGTAMKYLSSVFDEYQPKLLFILGDTNAAFAAAYVAKIKGVEIVHAEAGNRCYDVKRVPEEVNRYMIDSIADWHLCYTQRAREQLILEGKKLDRTIVVGNPIEEAISPYLPYAKNSIWGKFILSTIHRKENLGRARLHEIFECLNKLGHQVKLSYHPTLKSKVKEHNIDTNKFENIEFFPPCGFKEFLKLEMKSICVITDSGTVPEECYLLERPCVLLRYTTERPELLENNQMVLCSNPMHLKTCVDIAISELTSIHPIGDYMKDTSSNIVKIIARLIANEN